MGARTAVGAARIGWHELLTPDVARSTRFYSELFGWELEVWKPGEADYPMIRAGGSFHGGFVTPQMELPPHWVAYVYVDDVDEVAAAAERAGGTVALPPTDIPEVGRLAALIDPQGGAISAMAPASEATFPEGVFAWDELLTADRTAAERFYGAVFGWGTEPYSDTYTVFKAGEQQVGGMMDKPPMMPATAWLTYVADDDADATTERAQELGGSVLAGPLDVEGIGRFSTIADPLGAVIGVGRFAPQAA